MYPTTRQAIAYKLLDDFDLRMLLHDRPNVFYRTAPQDAVFPMVLMQKQSGVPVYALGGDWHENELWTIKAVDRSDTAAAAEELFERIKIVLQDAELAIEGYTTLYLKRESDLDYGEVEEGAMIHHIGAMFRLHRQLTPA